MKLSLEDMLDAYAVQILDLGFSDLAVAEKIRSMSAAAGQACRGVQEYGDAATWPDRVKRVGEIRVLRRIEALGEASMDVLEKLRVMASLAFSVVTGQVATAAMAAEERARRHATPED